MMLAYYNEAAMNEKLTWNAEAWVNDFRAAALTRDYYNLHALRIAVYERTIEIVNAGGYVSEAGEYVALPSTDAMVAGSRFYAQELPGDLSKTGRYETQVEVVENDCLLVVRELVKDDPQTCVLNMANRQNPGGGVMQGCGAQEEYLFRCSNYFRSLYQFAWYANQYGLTPSAQQYPMDRNFGGIFTPSVTIFRDCEEKGYPLLAQPWQVNMIAVAAMNRPPLEVVDGEERVVAHLVPAAKNKMRTIFRIARDNNQTTLVLGAIGCGAFRNPPAHTAELFREVLEDPEFAGVFKRVCFAIKEDHNSRGAGNYKPFAKVFGC